MDCLTKDREELLAFYDFPVERCVAYPHHQPDREPTFATVRLRSKPTRNCGSRETTPAMVLKLLESAQRGWRRMKSFRTLKLVLNNVAFRHGEAKTDQSDRHVA